MKAKPTTSALLTRVKRARTEIQWWYETFRQFVPPFGSTEFARTIAAGSDLAFEIAPAVQSVCIEDTDTAYFSFDDRRIHLPSYYVSYDGLSELVGADLGGFAKYVSLSLSNGTLVHEALHCRYTVETPKVALGKISSDCRHEIWQKGLFTAFYTVLNVFEDLAIEAMARNPKSGITNAVNEIVKIKNTFLLPREEFLRSIDEFDGSFDSLIRLIAGLKNTENKLSEIKHLLDPQDVKALNAIMNQTPSDSARSLTASFTARAQHAAEFVLRHADICSDDTSQESPDSGGHDIGSYLPAITKLGAKYLSDREKSGAEHEPSPELVQTIQAYLVQHSEVYHVSQSPDARWESLLGRSIAEHDILDPEISLSETTNREAHISPDLGFVRSLLIARTHNEIPGEPKNHGSRIVNTRLARIATDGKIFGSPMHVDLPKPLEVIVLVDMSGSTTQWVDYDGVNNRLVEFEVAFAKAFFEMLKQANITNSVYAHTSTHELNTPALFHIASFGMEGRSANQLEERFARMRMIPLKENYDGFIYKHIAQRFSRRPARKLLIVLSDGEPSGIGYRGSKARMHTQEVIAKLRKSGINVICLSVGNDDGVVTKNNDIFGVAYNVDASKSLKAEFERVISKFDQ
jgi:hypothetical protein